MTEPEETLDNFGSRRATKEDEGIYQIVKKIWDPGDVGHRFLVPEGAIRAMPIDPGGIPFDWSPYLVYSGHVERVPNTDRLFELLMEQRRLNAEIRKEMEQLG